MGARDTSTRAATAPTRPTEPAPDPLRPPAALVEAQPAAGWQLLTPNVLSVKHWERLLGGALYAATPRLDWASLLRRSFQVCARCGGRLRVLGEITEPTMVRLVLESLGIPTDAPRVARARDPTELLDTDQGR